MGFSRPIGRTGACLGLTAAGLGCTFPEILGARSPPPGRTNGKRSRPSRAKEQTMKRPTGVTILAVLAFIGAALLVAAALVSLLAGMLVSTMLSFRMGMIGGVGAAFLVIFFLLVFAVVDIMVGVGLWKLKNWARIITIVLTAIGLLGSVLSIISPFGHMHIFLFVFLIRRLILAAIYAWILWYLFQPNVKEAFDATGF
jgi:hypothetical protein